jgi:hypothetical protein
MVKMPEF